MKTILTNSSNVPSQLPSKLQSFPSDLVETYLEPRLPLTVVNLTGMHNVREENRVTLFTWLIDVVSQLRLSLDTLFLTQELVDKFTIEDKSIDRSNYQLLGVCCLGLASKIEEKDQCLMSDLSNLTAAHFSIEQINEMQVKILFSLNFDLSFVNRNKLILIMGSALQFNNSTIDLAQIMQACCMTKSVMLAIRPTLLAAGCLAYSVFVTNQNDKWKAFAFFANMEAIREVMDAIYELKDQLGEVLDKVGRMFVNGGEYLEIIRNI